MRRIIDTVSARVRALPRVRSLGLYFDKAARNGDRTGEQLFLISFAIYQAMCMWDTTMFPLPFWAELLGKAVALGIIAVKILLYDGYSPVKLVGFAAAGACTAFTAYTTKYIPPFVWVVYLAGSRDVSFRKILEVYLVVTGAGMLMAYAASMIGVIENLQYITEKRGIRNSFGIIYPTDFAAHVFYMLLIGFYLKGEKLKGIHYLGTVIIAALVYHFCNARLDSVSILMMTVLFWLGNVITRSRYKGDRVKKLWKQGWAKISPFIMSACLAVALGATYAYGAIGDTSQKLIELDQKISGGRLRQSWEGIKNYGLHLLGRYVPMIGNGGTTRLPAKYFFVDCSYINLLLRAGILFMAIILILYAISCRKNSHDLYFLYAVALISVNSMIAHHLAEPAYNPLLLAAFTGCVRETGDRYKISYR